MIVALALLQLAISQAPTTGGGGGTVDPRAGAPTDSAVGIVGIIGIVGTVDPAGTAAVSVLPTDDELRLLAERDLTQARAPLRRAARTADVAGTRALALRLLATHDASVATARICARSKFTSSSFFCVQLS
jgi:hypothetical protein